MGRRRRGGPPWRRWKTSTRILCALGTWSLLFGTFCLVAGGIWRHRNAYDDGDIRTVPATVVSVEQVERDLSLQDQERERREGRSGEEIRYAWSILWAYEADGIEHRYREIRSFGRPAPAPGDTGSLRIAVTRDGILIDPPSVGRDHASVLGAAAILAGVVLSALAVEEQRTGRPGRWILLRLSP